MCSGIVPDNLVKYTVFIRLIALFPFLHGGLGKLRKIFLKFHFCLRFRLILPIQLCEQVREP
jgi:hypothetical protein